MAQNDDDATGSPATSAVHTPLREGYRDARDRLAELEANPRRAAALARARKRMAETLHEAGSLGALRMSKGLSQTTLANKIGSSQSRLSSIESGRDDPRLSTVAKIAEALEVDVAVVVQTLLKK